jgi:RNA recognition motif-containing protein
MNMKKWNVVIIFSIYVFNLNAMYNFDEEEFFDYLQIAI